MKKTTNVILYTAGAYGHFINWCCEYFSGNLDSSTVPLNDLGSCHSFANAHLLVTPPSFKEYTNSDQLFEFVQAHECSFDLADTQEMFNGGAHSVIVKNLSYLQEHYQKSIYIYPTETSKIWIKNNQIYKIRISDWVGEGNEHLAEKNFRDRGMPDNLIAPLIVSGIDRIKKEIEADPSTQECFSGWGHNDIEKFELWELREFLSEYYYDRISSGIYFTSELEELLKEKFPSIKFIRLDNLRDDFKNTVKEILESFDIKIVNWNQIDKVYTEWVNKQKYINRDLELNQIVSALVNQENLDWSTWDLTFVDELSLQRLLADCGYKIKCYNLNQFPTNTKDFLPLLENNDH